MADRVVVAGVGIVPFAATACTGSRLAERAIRNALEDASIDVELIDQAVSSHVHGDVHAGERALFQAGLSGIAVSNVSNGAASASAALFHARQALLSGEAQCVLAVGFEEALQLSAHHRERAKLCAAHIERVTELMGIEEETLARVAVKARTHAAGNPCALHREPLSLEEALAAPRLAGRLRRPYWSAASCGAAAVVLCSARFAALHGLRDDVLLAAHVLEVDDPPATHGPNLLDRLGRATTRRVAEKAYESAGVDPGDIDVAEVHDCCVGNELISCAALGLCAEHELERFVRSGANTYGGKVVVSPSGGLLSIGNAPGASGLAQVCELTLQLRCDAGRRQVARARVGLQHNGEAGGAIAVTILRRKH
jgi:acetyl-CoA acetyltransferase